MTNILSQKLIEGEAPPKTAYTKRYDYDGSGKLIYEGWAWAGANVATASASWAIKLYTYTGTNLVLIQWANGNSSQSNIWDNRTTLTYQ